MAYKRDLSIVLKDAEKGFSYGVSVNYAKASRRALKIAELTGRSVIIETREVVYPDLPF